jgi:pheromone shutdown protein TraB
MLQVWKNVSIVGSSHIAAESVREIKRTLQVQQPAIVCVELDPARANALMRNEKSSLSPLLVFRVGVAGYFFVLIGRMVQQKLGDVVGLSAGADMKMAIEYAQKQKITLALIDQPIEITLQDLSKKFTWREKLRLLSDTVFPPHIEEIDALKRHDLRRVPSAKIIVPLLAFLAKRYPGLYAAIIGKRNSYMAKKLYLLHTQSPAVPIVAVMGAGHVEGVFAELLRLERAIDIVRKSSGV